MKKSIYSLVLSDDVIREIDRLAYVQGTSRSNLINQILAERVSMATPEMRNRDIFLALEQLMGETFQRMNPNSDSVFAVRSPLRFKYKPTIRYQLELYRDPGETIGSLRVSLRTQNRQLLDLLDLFFEIWEKLESHYLEGVFGHRIACVREDGRMTRELYAPVNLPVLTGEDVGAAIAGYIQNLDGCIKVFFAHAEAPAALMAKAVEQEYAAAVRKKDYLII